MSEATIVREEFQQAFQASVDRAMIYQDGQRQIEHIFELALNTVFQVATNPNSVEDLFIRSIENNPDSAQILDFLHGFISDFTFGLLLHDPALPEKVYNNVVKAVCVNNVPGHSVLPEHYRQSLSTESTARDIAKANSWYYALMVIRLFGTSILTSGAQSTAQTNKPRRGGVLDGG